MWNFVTDSTGFVPTTLLDSALSIEDFDDEFDEDDDFEARSYNHDLSRHNDHDDEYDDDTAQQNLTAQMTPEEKASEESFANLPAGTGVYRVQYTFTAEAPQEMEVQEGDHVRVWQQLCDGWVLGAKIVRKESLSSSTPSDRVEYSEPCSGLVPQSYLVFSHTVTLTQGDEENSDGQDRTVCYTTHVVDGSS